MPVNFDILSEAYDAMINWEKRLANESPLYRWLFECVGARSVLDAACGSGRHAVMFASWGLSVEGADLSEEMIAFCRKEYAANGIRWTVRSFNEPIASPADVVVCTGNSLALVDDEQQVVQALRAMAQGAAKAVVVQVVNLYSREEGPILWDKCRQLQLSIGPSVVNKGIHRCGDRGYVDFVLTPLQQDQVAGMSRSVRFLGLRPEMVGRELRNGGMTKVEFYGNYARQPYEPERSGDLIVVAFR